eukprot:TRINITY_DN8482_c0_g1_i3.p1 TRINITY_DN8482_c0_g1~~TRINITY_DN8482_c0_g1_i3.p1  ORF type:complete len:492 (+),score=103.14 TRINITY_DN8482_c0_g1_i3:80-1555(+)
MCIRDRTTSEPVSIGAPQGSGLPRSRCLSDADDIMRCISADSVCSFQDSPSFTAMVPQGNQAPTTMLGKPALSESSTIINPECSLRHLVEATDTGLGILLAADDMSLIGMAAGTSRSCRQVAEDAAKHICTKHYKRRPPASQSDVSWVSLLGNTRCSIKRELAWEHKGVCSMIPLRDGRFASGSNDNIVRVWGGHGDCQLSMEGHTGAVGVLLELSGSRLLSGSADSTLRIWSLEDGQCRKLLEGHSAKIKCAALVGNHIVTGAVNAIIRVWSLNGNCEQSISMHGGGVTALSGLSDTQFMSCGHDGSVCRWNVDGSCVFVLKGHADSVWSVLVRSETVISASDDQTVRVWHRDGNLVDVIDLLATGAPSEADDDAEQSSEDVTLACVAELSGGRVALGTFEGAIQIWDASVVPAKRLLLLEGHTKMVHAVQQLQDGRILSASRDGTLRIWQQNGECACVFQADKAPVAYLVELSDGRIVSGSKSQLALWV